VRWVGRRGGGSLTSCKLVNEFFLRSRSLKDFVVRHDRKLVVLSAD
jgi:hypothetical protein